MGDVLQWTSDSLYDLIGLSDQHTAEFLIQLAKKSKSLESFVDRLEDTASLSVDHSLRDFAQQLWDKVPHASIKEKPERAKEREAIRQREKNKSYQLIIDPEDEDVSSSLPTPTPELGIELAPYSIVIMSVIFHAYCFYMWSVQSLPI
jgi:pre-mRNA-splicing factor ATP-dependent RNA helicase DHX16